MHALRYGFASMAATDLDVPAPTLARVTGHTDPGFTLKLYARDSRDDAVIVQDMLGRAKRAKVARWWTQQHLLDPDAGAAA